jgi:hypothetical protein
MDAISFGTIPYDEKAQTKRGDFIPTDMLTKTSPNQTGSHSRALTMGMNMSIVTIMIACSISMP